MTAGPEGSGVIIPGSAARRNDKTKRDSGEIPGIRPIRKGWPFDLALLEFHCDEKPYRKEGIQMARKMKRKKMRMKKERM